MTPSTEIFDLIKSLAKSEKRYIRLNFSIHKGDKNYLKLFDAIEKQDEYDEEQIKKNFSKELFIKRLPVAKAYLYATLLKVLRQYHASGSAEVRIKEMVHEVEILFNKGLFSQAHKILLRAKKIAYQYEKSLLLIDISKWESRLMGLLVYLSKKTTDYSNIIAEEDQNLTRLQKNVAFKKLSWELSDAIKNIGISNTKELKEEFSKMDLSLLEKKPDNVDFDTLVYYYHTSGNYCRVLGDHKKFYLNMRALLDLYESNPIQIEDYPYNMLGILNNYIHAVNLLKKHDEALTYLSRIKNIPFSSRLKYLLIYETVLRIESTIYAQQERFNDVIKLIADNEKELHELEADKTQLSLFRIYLNAAWSYFNLKKYSSAIKYLNKILNDKNIKNNIDFRLQAELLNLILHYEMGNLDLMESLIKSQYFLIKKKYKHNRFHLFVLELFEKLFKAGGKNSHLIIKGELTVLKKNAAADNEIMNSLIQCDFFMKWLESK